MQTNYNKPAKMNRKQLMTIARKAAACNSIQGFRRWLNRWMQTNIPQDNTTGSWWNYGRKLLAGLTDSALNKYGAPFSVFTWKTNMKLRFPAFSVLPVVMCPGAGECAEWCYTFKSWRKPSCFWRQVCNTLLMRFRHDVIAAAFHGLKNRPSLYVKDQESESSYVIVRLYVDGDFDSEATVRFWMRELKAAESWCLAYGYSKSWDELLAFEGFNWPSNYALNLSNGSAFDDRPEYWERMRALPITRGEFLGIETEGRYSKAAEERYSDIDYHAEIRRLGREQLGLNAFSCPGDCNNCGSTRTPVPICADRNRAQGLTVLNGIH